MRSAGLVGACVLGLSLACANGGGSSVPADGVAVGSDPAPSKADPHAPPRLVLLLVVDQMRFDYFDRYASRWKHGFSRLRDESLFFTEAYHAHALTETAPGHATISTGMDPARHGMVANRVWNRAANEKAKVVDDPDSKVLGNEDVVGVSAAPLLSEGLGDWMHAADERSIVVSLAIKDRAAILLGGKRPDAAIWYDDGFGGFTTSTYYADARPEWVDAYNAKGRAEQLYGEQGWTPAFPDEAYADTRRETAPEFVSTHAGYSLTKRFPHVIDDAGRAAGKGPRNVVRDTPFGDQMTLELARDAIAATGLGRDEIPDLLALSVSGGDYVGHRYGPNSMEMDDYYLRLDALLGELVTDLDTTIGRDAYVLVLTSDHGVTPVPDYNEGVETAGRFLGRVEVPPMMTKVAKELSLKKKERPTLGWSHGVDLVWPEHVSEEVRVRYRAALAERLREHPLLTDAWTRDELARNADRNPLAPAWRRSFHPERSSDILLQLAPGVTTYPQGTGHGTPYAYDQHVPLLVRGVGTGEHTQRVHTTDIAPTLARMLGIAPPESLDGHAIEIE
jgi:predicted AlkP superfamily pyrophosphatase or phosphodiesterase